MRVGAIAVVAGLGALALAPTLGAAETFPPRPGPDQSRCAALLTSATIVSVGAKIEASAGPATTSCGGPSTSVTWSWPSDDPDLNQVEGLIKTHACPKTSATCEFKAVLPTPAGQWEAICIGGESPQGPFSSCQPYAVLIGPYHFLTGTIFDVTKTVKVTVTGPGGRRSTTTDSGGVWRVAVKKGTYTVTFTARGRHFRRKVKVRGKPGTATTLNIVA